MQILGPRTSTFGTVYSAAAIQTALTTPGQEQWLFDLLDASGKYVSDLTTFVEKGSRNPVISHDSTQAVKRSLSIRFRGDVPLFSAYDPSINRQIRAHYQVLMPDGGFVDFILGTFVVLPSSGETYPAGAWHDLVGTDYGQLLLDFNFQITTSVPAGSNAISAVTSLASVTGGATSIQTVIPDLGKTLAAAITWDQGMSRLKAINDILAAINYFPAWFDEGGALRSAPIPDWNTVQPSFIFDTTQSGSITRIPLKQSTDWSQAGNIQTVIVEDSRRPAFSQTYINSNPASPVSTGNWHPKSLTPIKDSNIPDPASALAVARSACQAAARIYQTWSVESFAWPVSQDYDVYQLIFSDPDDGLLQVNFVETGWSMQCKAGSGTTHTWNRIVPA